MTMAKARVNKTKGLVFELPECPVCLETMSAPIYQCQSGHSLCDSCTKSFNPPICPICRQPKTQTRNWELEKLIAKATTNCPNRASGCCYRSDGDQVENHVKECIFRVMTCPLGIFRRCSWSGALKEMLDHIKTCHHQNILLDLNQEVTINDISVTRDNRFVYIVPQGKMIYILTLIVDISKQLAYGALQLIACKKVAQQHIYEINIHSLQDNRRRIYYSEHCFSDAMTTAEILQQARCCVIPLTLFAQFIKDKMMTFSLNVKKAQPVFTKEPNTSRRQFNSYYRGRSPSSVCRYPSASRSQSRSDQY